MSARFSPQKIVAPMNIEDVKRMIEEYHGHPKRLVNSESGETLKGLVMEKTDLLDLLGLQDDEAPDAPEKFMILFAVAKDDVRKEVADQVFTAIMAPVADEEIDLCGTKKLFDPRPPCEGTNPNYDVLFYGSKSAKGF